MNYVERVTNFSPNEAVGQQPIPLDVVSDALELRTSPIVEEVFTAHEAKLGLNGLSVEQKHLARARIVGSITTRFAMASFYTPDVTPFVDLSETHKLEHVNSLVDKYATSSIRTQEEGSNQLLIDSSIDPMSTIKNEDASKWVYEARLAAMSISERLELIRSYINIVPGSFPKTPHTIAPIASNDATYTQAFGRDSITDKELVIIKDERRKLGDDALMMEYLDSIHFTPGPSNDALSEKIHQILNGDNPNEQMVQWEVAFSLWKNYPDTYARFKDYLHILWPSRGFYPTFEVKRDSIHEMHKVGALNPAELAHGDMMIRALGIISAQGVIADPLDVSIPFDPNSTQPHVRNAKSWVVREFLTRGEHVLRGRVRF